MRITLDSAPNPGLSTRWSPAISCRIRAPIAPEPDEFHGRQRDRVAKFGNFSGRGVVAGGLGPGKRCPKRLFCRLDLSEQFL